MAFDLDKLIEEASKDPKYRKDVLKIFKEKIQMEQIQLQEMIKAWGDL